MEKTTSNSQCKLLLKHLKERGSISALEAVERYGIGRLSARIMDLREGGYAIETEMVTAKNRYGKSVTFGKYKLAENEK